MFTDLYQAMHVPSHYCYIILYAAIITIINKSYNGVREDQVEANRTHAMQIHSISEISKTPFLN
jgi:hypothetical protein